MDVMLSITLGYCAHVARRACLQIPHSEAEPSRFRSRLRYQYDGSQPRWIYKTCAEDQYEQL